jgi:translation initiation factor IF-2
MPVRIYDIAKKLGVENKVVLAKAKELGIAHAKVPSSSLDKITAAYLEEQMGGLAAPPAQTTPLPPTPEPVVLVTAPPEVEPPAPEPPAPPETAPEPPAEEIAPAPPTEEALPELPALPEAPPPVAPPEPVETEALPEVVAPAEMPAEVEAETPAESPPLPEPPTEPPPVVAPPKTQIGQLVGRIELPTRPLPRSATTRPGTKSSPPPRGPARPGAPSWCTPPARPDGKAAPGPARFVAPTSGELIIIKPPIVVRDLAAKLNRRPFQVIADLIELGVFATVNQAIDEPVAQQLCAKHGFRFEVEKRERGGGVVHAPRRPVEQDLEDRPEDLRPRAPVVTIMGHVDHGKTTLLDVIRKTNVVAKESGGITQHIGAYTISIPHPERKKEMQQITFLDTPGHAAFTAMRARGANVTDIVVLVVAANDGVMPQTIEAITHATDANVPIVVAVNKCDHPAANPMKARQQLQDRGLVCEEWGGNTIFVDVSALKGQGVDKLLEMLVLQAEYLELKANPNRPAKGSVVESGVEPGGPTATVLVRKGTLRLGNTILSGPFYGRVRALINADGERLKEAGPSMAVKVLGLNGPPEPGVEFTVMASEKDARVIADRRTQDSRSGELSAANPSDFWDRFGQDQKKVLKIVVKTDTQGSAEAIADALRKIKSEKASLEIKRSDVGSISENDVNLLAASTGASLIVGFHTRIDAGVAELAKRHGVRIKLYAVIYELIDEVRLALAGLLDPLSREVVVGTAEVRKLFELSKGGKVAGCVITNGRVTRGKVRVMRRKNLLYEGLTASLRRFQDEVNEVRSGMECGIRIEGFNDFQLGDLIESYVLEQYSQDL